MNKDKIGSLWISEGKGKKYLSGSIKIDDKEHKIVVFKNDYKKDGKHPDYNILLKAVPKAFVDGIEGVGLHPIIINI